jgi:VWFA-related protein
MTVRWLHSGFKEVAAVVAMAAILMPSGVVRAQSQAGEGARSTPAQTAQPQQGLYRFKVTSDLVLVSVTVRDKRGNLVRDLKQSDFTIAEDGKAQKISSFDIQDVQSYAEGGPAQMESQGKPEKVLTTAEQVTPDILRDRRLIVLFFDFTSMQPDEVERAMSSAEKFVEKQMTPADLVAVVTLGNTLKVEQDFTADRDALTRVLRRVHGVDGQGFESTDMNADSQTENGQAFSADDTEYNIFNTDRKLQAIAAISQTLGRLDQKKSILFFGGGVEKTGTENQSQLRAAINAAVRANVSLYPVDVRGLQAMVPGGNATQASLRGTSAYSGRAVSAQFDSNFQSQETLVTLASDTGGKAFLDTNDFGKAYEKVQADSAAYYVLGYRSSNTNMDGRLRRITVKVNRADLKLEYRNAYYGPRDFRHFTKDDREQQLDDEIASDLPNTDLPVYLSTEFFRSEEDKNFVPVSIVVPGNAIPFAQASDNDKATLDVLGVVREKQTKFPVGNIRETVKLAVDGAQNARRKNIQYNTGFQLAPGTYHVKFVVRENENGKMGSFETDLDVPDLKKQQLKMSSIVIANQKTPAPKKKSPNPLVQNGSEIVPNVAHVFSTDQTMYFYYEVYSPAAVKSEQKTPTSGKVRVLTSIQFFKGKVKAYETALVEAKDLNAPERKAAAFQFEVPLSNLKPGWYTCQVTVIDDAAGTFSFPRLPMLVREAKAAVATAMK